jgi:hypothetical protein
VSAEKTTIDHAQNKQWVEERGGHPARLRVLMNKGTAGVLVNDYPGYSGTQTLETISWDDSSKALKRTN